MLVLKNSRKDKERAFEVGRVPMSPSVPPEGTLCLPVPTREAMEGMWALHSGPTVPQSPVSLKRDDALLAGRCKTKATKATSTCS